MMGRLFYIKSSSRIPPPLPPKKLIIRIHPKMITQKSQYISFLAQYNPTTKKMLQVTILE